MQALVTDAVVLAAAAWLVWSFAPAGLRRLVLRRRAAPAYDAALQADQLDGRTPADPDCACADKPRP